MGTERNGTEGQAGGVRSGLHLFLDSKLVQIETVSQKGKRNQLSSLRKTLSALTSHWPQAVFKLTMSAWITKEVWEDGLQSLLQPVMKIDQNVSKNQGIDALMELKLCLFSFLANKSHISLAAALVYLKF